MTIPNMPMVTNEIVDLVETMRQAQLHYDGLVNNRDSHANAHQVRRAEQAKKAAEQKVDLWLLSYRAELKKYMRVFELQGTNELPGMYDAKKKD